MFESLKARLIDDWKWVLKNSWSVRLVLVAAALSGVEVVLPFFSDKIPAGRFALLSFAVTAAALIARFVAQKRDE